jgi:hypothetical protein
MNIYDSMIKSYLNDKDDYKEHWLFFEITENDEYVFEQPDPDLKVKVKFIYNKTCDNLNNFSPFNEPLFTKLFPKWRELVNDVNVILAVGCPSPYDAMVREHDGTQYIILDLIRFLSYENKTDDIISIIVGMITHEFAHVCIHNDYPYQPNNYTDKLKYIVFDEGFAHLLALNNNISSFDFSNMIKQHYKESVRKLKLALTERDIVKQEIFLEDSNSGSYWAKFAAIIGKLYLASHLDSLHNIYKSGPELLIVNMEKEAEGEEYAI